MNLRLSQYGICIFAGIMSSLVAYGVNSPITDPIIPIVVTPSPPIPEDAPRYPSTTRIEAALDVEFCTVEVRLQNAGSNVTVSVDNTTTGTHYTYVVTGNGSDYLPISGYSGYWTITFTLSNGDVYIGSFII